jgi:hypothetical protein
MKNAAYALAAGIPLLTMTACAGTRKSDCNPFDGCPRDGLVGALYQGVGGLAPLVATVTAYQSPTGSTPTLTVAETMQTDSSGDFDLTVAAGDYLLCVAAAGCPADSATSSCCTQASAPSGFGSYLWEGGQWSLALP